MASTSPVAPTLHLNGTSFANLSEQYELSVDALRRALSLLPEPNARDYYVAGDSVAGQARAQHADRIARVRAVLAEVESIYDALCEQNYAQRR